jgi:hypothetical protein
VDLTKSGLAVSGKLRPPQIVTSESQIPKSHRAKSAGVSKKKGNQTVDYFIVFITLIMVALYGLLIHWLLPKT